jgi:hypothetical protein
MWLDFNYNYSHSHHVAVVVSIQGVNPITGQATKQLRLEQYRERCPVHDTPFGQDRFCEQCNYKWDGQNYISSNSTPRGLFWIDGFRHANGVVRQYIFTKESCKGVAAQVIGEDRVFAIGIAFYLSKEPKKVAALPEQNTWKLGDSSHTKFMNGQHLNKNSRTYSDIATFKRISTTGGASAGRVVKGFPPSNTISPGVRISDQEDLWLPQKPVPSKIECSMPPVESLSCGVACGGMADTTDFDTMEYSKSSPSDIQNEVHKKTPEEIEQEMEKLEITAGAKIKQRIYLDPEEPGFWQEEPAGFIYVNYVDIETAEKIMAAGRKERAGSFLSAMEF